MIEADFYKYKNIQSILPMVKIVIIITIMMIIIKLFIIKTIVTKMVETSLTTLWL